MIEKKWESFGICSGKLKLKNGFLIYKPITWENFEKIKEERLKYPHESNFNLDHSFIGSIKDNNGVILLRVSASKETEMKSILISKSIALIGSN